jgi:hypothetical protein
MEIKETAMPNNLREDTVRVTEDAVLDVIVGLMQDVCTKENLAQALLVPASVLQQYDDIAAHVEGQGGNERATRAVAAMATMDHVRRLRSFWKKEKKRGTKRKNKS